MDAPGLTLDVAISSWERALRARNRSPRTIRSYVDTARLLESFLHQHHMPIEVAAITSEHLEPLIDDQLRRWRPATAAVRYRALQQLFAWLVSREAIPCSPMAKMRAPMVPQVPVRVVPGADLRQLLEPAGGSGSRTSVTRPSSGSDRNRGPVRLSEVAGLTGPDVDLDRSELMVLCKGTKRRSVPYGDRTAASVRRYLVARVGHPKAGLPRLWLARRGPLTASGIAQALRRRCRQAGVPMAHPHQLRHSAAHIWLALGGSEGDATRLFGLELPGDAEPLRRGAGRRAGPGCPPAPRPG